MSDPHSPPARHVVTDLTSAWYRSKWFNLVLGLIVTFACLGYALYVMADGEPIDQVFRKIGLAFRQANYVTLLPIWMMCLLFYWIKAWRWRMLLAPLGDYPTSRLFPPTIIGFAFNNVLPAHLGEFFRVFVFARQSGLPKSAVFTTIAVERLFDLIAILFFMGIGLLFVPDLTDDVRRSAVIFACAAAVAIVGAAAYLIWPQQFTESFEWCVNRVSLVPTGLKQKVFDLVETGATGLSSLRSGKLVAGIVVTSLMQWALNGLLIHISLWSFGIHVSPLVSLITLGVLAFGVTVPSSPGYFGVIQLCFLASLSLFVPEDQEPAVMAASIYYHMSNWILVTPLGGWYFVRSGLQVGEIEEQVETPNDKSDRD